MNEDELEKMVSGFGSAPLKIEGQSVNAAYGIPEGYTAYQLPYLTTYVEVDMPVALEDMAHEVLKAMRTQWLIDNGFEEGKE